MIPTNIFTAYTKVIDIFVKLRFIIVLQRIQ